jgi:hypothetical protein
MRATRDRWLTVVRDFLSPGPPPRPLVVVGVAAFAVTILAIAFLIWLGIHVWGVPDKYFRERRAGTYYSAVLLLASGAVAAAIARRTSESSARRFWAVAGVGFAYLALDDMLSLHEELDKALHDLMGWDRRHWLTDHLDDAIIVSYGLIAAAWAYGHRHAFRSLRWARLLLAAAFAGFAGMVVVDAIGRTPTLEEAMKLLSGTMIVIALLAAYLDPERSGRRPGNRA